MGCSLFKKEILLLLILLDSVPVSYVSSITHLGIHINLCLNFDEHFCSITKKFRSRVNLLRHMSSTLPASAATLLYKAYVRPVVEYATPVWALWLKQSQLQSLEILQASAVRCFLRKLHISFDFDSPKAKLNELCGLKSLQYRRQIFFLRTLHKIIHKHPEFLRLSNLSISTIARRPNKVVFHSNGTHTSRSFLFVISTLWNCLPPSLTSLEHPHVFRSALRKATMNYRFSGIPSP